MRIAMYYKKPSGMKQLCFPLINMNKQDWSQEAAEVALGEF